MSRRYEGPRQTWLLYLGGSPEVVELLPYSGRLWGAPNTFTVGTTERKLEWPPGLSRWQRTKAPLVGSVDVGGRRLTMTQTTTSLSYRSAVRRNITGGQRRGVLGLLTTIVGFLALGGGGAAATQSTLTWLTYALDMDGEALGSWVGKTVDGLVERWTWVPPGGPLPDTKSLDWSE